MGKLLGFRGSGPAGLGAQLDVALDVVCTLPVSLGQNGRGCRASRLPVGGIHGYTSQAAEDGMRGFA